MACLKSEGVEKFPNPCVLYNYVEHAQLLLALSCGECPNCIKQVDYVSYLQSLVHKM